MRCEWAETNDLMRKYHDEEWGVPLHEDRALFEFLVLDGFQAGLSWAIILNKRESFRKAFDNFEAEKIAGYDDNKIAQLLENPGIVRNKLKINAAISNARAYLDLKYQEGSFSDYLWSFTGGRPIVNSHDSWKEIPPVSKESDEMSKNLKKRGFKFVGSTICYAFMQAAGLVNDHINDCYRREEIISGY
jgi:DNA-3-methyladenine glycosylase I